MLTVTRSTAKLGVAGLLAIVFTCPFLVGPARAGGIDPVDCSKTPNHPKCRVEVGVPGGGPDDRGGSGAGGPRVCREPLTGREIPCSLPGYGELGDDGCYYRPAVGQELRTAEAIGGPATPPKQWYIGQCGYPPSPTLTKLRLFAGGVPDPAALAAQAVRELELPLPAIRVNPPPPAKQLVFLPTWLWLDASSWRTRTATATVPGLSVTATAKPSTLVFTTGDGGSVTCSGSGVAWPPGTDPRRASPTCGHTYSRPGRVTLTATVTWQISWAGGGQAGTVPDVVTTAAVPLEITESQALNTNP